MEDDENENVNESMNENENENKTANGDDMQEAGPSPDMPKDSSVTVAAPRLHKLQDLVCDNLPFSLRSLLGKRITLSLRPSHKPWTILLCLGLQTCVHSVE